MEKVWEHSPNSGRLVSVERPIKASNAQAPIHGIAGVAALASASIASAYTAGLVYLAKFLEPEVMLPSKDGSDPYHDQYTSFKYEFSPPRLRHVIFEAHPPPG